MELPKTKEDMSWVCQECGEEYGYTAVSCSTYHTGTCHVCGKETAVTQLRDWGYLPGLTPGGLRSIRSHQSRPKTKAPAKKPLTKRVSKT
jgi:hypothetical protein